jgi:hypothetical protein
VRKKHRCAVPILEGHKDYEFREGDLLYYDSYAGKNWAPGREVVFLKGVPVWCMAYQGSIMRSLMMLFFRSEHFFF